MNSPGTPRETLTAWDQRLIDKHLSFYRSLHIGNRIPKTKAQHHFILVCRGEARPHTQHEIAYTRYLALNRSVIPLVEAAPPRAPRPAKPGTPTPSSFVQPSYKVISIVDRVEEEAFEARSNNARRTLRKIADLYKSGIAKARNTSADASLWLGAFIADRDLSASIERWTGSALGDYSDIYTKAMDGLDYLKGLKFGVDYIAPLLHRIFEGHTIASSWRAARDALPDDTFTEEVIGWIKALATDVVTPAGLPIMELSPGQFEALKGLASKFQIPEEWLRDSLTYTGTEIVGAMLPGIAAALNWRERDAEEFARMAGGSIISAVISANPILAVISIALLARAYHLGRFGDGQSHWAKGLARGGIATGAVLAGSAMVGGPTAIGLIAGAGLYFAISKSRKSINADEAAEWLRMSLKPASA
jgi:hypothetical protein